MTQSIVVDVVKIPRSLTVQLRVGGEVWATVGREGGGKSTVCWSIVDSANRMIRSDEGSDSYKREDAIREAIGLIQSGKILPPEQAAEAWRMERSASSLRESARRFGPDLYDAAKKFLQSIEGDVDLQRNHDLCQILEVVERIERG